MSRREAEALVEQDWWNIDAFAQALLKHGLIAGDIRAFFILAKSCAGNRVRGSKLTRHRQAAHPR
jgi:hypothetical protein